MLYEFALEPEALNNWQAFRFFVEHFGVEHGRLISKFPGNWRERVWHASRECRDLERKRIEVLLRQCEPKMLSKGRFFDFNREWLDNAETQHARDPFRAIIAADNPRNNPNVLKADEVPSHEGQLQAKWLVDCEQSILRTSAALLNSCRTLLEISEEIIIVDPQIDLTKARWRRSLSPIIRFVFARARPPRRFEIHTKLKDGYGLFVRETPAELRQKCLEHLPSITPRGSIVRFVAWSSHGGGKNLHVRYLLTERGGLRIDAGFDEGEVGETNDVGMLRQSMYETCWADYRREQQAGQASTFRLEVDVEITGTSR